MDFSNRSSQGSAQRPVSQSTGTNSSNNDSASVGKRQQLKAKLATIGSTALLFCITILVAALVLLVGLGNTPNEGKFVKDKNLQAVFLNNGQVYFGNIKSLNEKFINLTGVYYLRVNGDQSAQAQASSNNVSLVKLGCELHGPTDQMLINRDQVTFWENLKTDGQVAKAVDNYKKTNPTQNCAQDNASSTSQATPNQPSQSSTSAPATTPSASSSTQSTKKP
jgi:hypothetical protein